MVGEAAGEVAATGARTAIADISHLASSATRPRSPLTRQLDRVVRLIAVIAVVVAASLGLISHGLGLAPIQAFLFAVGVAVALVPEGLLPTVTLSLARGATLMASSQALVRRLDAVETLGATSFICTDKTGTLTQNRMSVVEVWTPAGVGRIVGNGYSPVGTVTAGAEVVAAMTRAAATALHSVAGRAVQTDAGWVAQGDPMEAALHVWALRLGVGDPAGAVDLRLPYAAETMLSCTVVDGVSHVLGAPESVLARCAGPVPTEVLAELASRGRRVLAVAVGSWHHGEPRERAVQGLDLLALVGLEDPPRPDVGEALLACHSAGIRVAMVTGDHPGTAAAVAREIGLLGPEGVVLDGPALPPDDQNLAALLDRDGGVVVARVSPADKLRIARALRARGHVVAMTGDGVNDAPALKEADVGVAMGRSGSDVARQSADLVLLDDHFATIVKAIELGRATFANVRRFLTYHLTDNVAELAPFVVWALSGGQIPLAISVLHVLALDIGTDMLPALALGAEPPSPRTLQGRFLRRVVDGPLLLRSFVILGLTEALGALTAFLVVLSTGGWTLGSTPAVHLQVLASGTAFATIAVAQMANAFACRSETVSPVRLPVASNRLLLVAVALEIGLLTCFLAIPALSDLLGGSWPTGGGWAMAVAAAAVLLVVDSGHKRLRRAMCARGPRHPGSLSEGPGRPVGQGSPRGQGS